MSMTVWSYLALNTIIFGCIGLSYTLLPCSIAGDHQYLFGGRERFPSAQHCCRDCHSWLSIEGVNDPSSNLWQPECSMCVRHLMTQGIHIWDILRSMIYMWCILRPVHFDECITHMHWKVCKQQIFQRGICFESILMRFTIFPTTDEWTVDMHSVSGS